MGFPNHITIILEPTAECNIRCRHCYHAKSHYDNNRMTLDQLEGVVKSLAPYYSYAKIIWHGGEPLLMGVDFFQKAYELFDKYSAQYGIKFEFGIQTNAILLDLEFAKLFDRTNTHISISYDGKFNDCLRQETSKVEQSIKMLIEYKMKFSCISTISNLNVSSMIDMYEDFKRIGISAKFNPIIPDGFAKYNADIKLSKHNWTANFLKLFEHWLFDTECNINLTSCYEVLLEYLGIGSRSCKNGTCMFRYLAVDAYGNLYPCGRLMEKNLLLCNVNDIDDIRKAFISDKYIYLLEENKKRVAKCVSCEWFGQCNSGCNASSYIKNDLSNPYDFDCYFKHKVYQRLKELLKNINIQSINKYARNVLE